MLAFNFKSYNTNFGEFNNNTELSLIGKNESSGLFFGVLVKGDTRSTPKKEFGESREKVPSFLADQGKSGHFNIHRINN